MGHAGSKKKKGEEGISGLGVSEETFANIPSVELEALEELFHSIAEQKDGDEIITFEKFQTFSAQLKTGHKIPAKKMFEAIDLDHSGGISKREFLAAMFIFGHGTLEERLKFVFHMYDSEGKGKLDKTQVRKFARACSKSAGLTVQLSVPELQVSEVTNEQSIDQIVDDIFKKFDANSGEKKKEKITFDKFYAIAKDHPGIQAFIANIEVTIPSVLHLDKSASSSSTSTPKKTKGRQGVHMEKQAVGGASTATRGSELKPAVLSPGEEDEDEGEEGAEEPKRSPGPGRRTLAVQPSTATSTERSKSPPRGVAMGSTSTKVKRDFP